MRDPDSGNSKGFAFVKFASFDAADAAIDAMNGQHLCNRPISVSYAFKKEAKGERHGSAAGVCVLVWVGGVVGVSMCVGGWLCQCWWVCGCVSVDVDGCAGMWWVCQDGCGWVVGVDVDVWVWVWIEWDCVLRVMCECR